MRLLILGGTLFAGRHLVDAALARGHDVTLFTRGRRALPWPGRVASLAGDRDPREAPGTRGAGQAARWDAVVDTSGYVPRVVAASVDRLAGRVRRYLFVSSVSVYAGTSNAGPARGLAGRRPRGSLERGRADALRGAQGRVRVRSCASGSAMAPRWCAPG